MEEIWLTLEFWVAIAHWLTGIGTIVLAVALFKTFKHLEVVTNMSKIETEYRLRPWIGPITELKKWTTPLMVVFNFQLQLKTLETCLHLV